ncbi:MAG: glutamyl-tRNA reductase [Saprospiraceae bacterium]
MLQHFHILTVTHRFTSLQRIGEFVLRAEGGSELREELTGLRDRMDIDELCYTATCNRVLFVFTTRRPVNRAFIESFFTGSVATDVFEQVKHWRGEAAAAHLFEVASSVDSLVIGERQILGQLRDSYEQCRLWGLAKDDLRILYHQMVTAAKDVYASTRIGEKSVSIVSLAMQRMLRHSLVAEKARVILIGAGQTNGLAAKFLKKYHFEHVTVFNRSLPKAESIAAKFAHGHARCLTELADYRGGFEVLFVCTGATEHIIHADNFDGLLAGDSPERKLVIDLAVPANVSPDLVREQGFSYVAIESLKQLADENMAFRGREIKRARVLLERHELELEARYRQRLLERSLAHLPTEVRAVRQRAVDQVFNKELATLSTENRALMERMLDYMEKKCIGIPMRATREAMLAENDNSGHQVLGE